MMRLLLRHGAVRLIGGRAVPALMLIDLALLANRARKVPVVDRNLRRGAEAVGRRAGTAFTGRRAPRQDDVVDPPHRYYSPPPR
jgi:hypothetical protein